MPLHPREHPIYFTFHNIQGEPTLTLSAEQESQVVHVTLVNRDPNDLNLPQGSSFKLITRKDIFTSIDQIKPDYRDGWLLGAFTFTTTRQITLAKADRIRFKFRNVKINPAFNAYTARIELQYDLPGIQAGFLEQPIFLAHHFGKRVMPVHVGIVGSRTVLNNGQANAGNTIRLRITNTAREPLSFDAESAFTFHFDVDAAGQTDDWALASANDVGGIRVALQNQTFARKELQGRLPVWVANPFSKPTNLAAREYLDFVFDNFVTAHPPGETNLYIAYREVPDYWDSQFVAPIQKGPLVLEGGNVGIGAPNPTAKLDVAGVLHVSGALSLEPASTIQVNYTPAFAENNRKFVAFATDFKKDSARGQAHFYAPNNYNDNVPALTLVGRYGAGGDVGINKTEPEARLHVGGDLKTDGTIHAGNDLAVDGRAILATDLVVKNNVDVKKDIHVGGDLHAGGAIHAENSAIHFRKTDRKFDPDYGGPLTASIQNTVDQQSVGSLMILGRSDHAGANRKVSIWDDLTVNSHVEVYETLWAKKSIKCDGPISPGSDRESKTGIAPVDPGAVLAGVLSMPISHWSFKAQADVRHIGPMAQDFLAAFGVGSDDKHICVLDSDGVALAAIQGLHALVTEKDEEIRTLELRLAALERGLKTIVNGIRAVTMSNETPKQ